MLTWSDIWSYIRVMLRWWWVALLAALLAAGSAQVIALRQPDYYVSRTTLRVGDTLSTAIPDPQMIGLSNTVTSFYAEMAKREVILKPVVEKLALPFPWQVIRDYMLSTSVNRQASLLEITITDTNPQRAAAIADSLAAELIRFGPNSPENITAQRNLLNEQIERAQREIEALDRQIEQTRDMLAQATSAADLREARNRLQELELSRDSAQNAYTQLLRLQNTSLVNSLTVFEAASIPTTPLPNKRNLTVAVAGLAGLILGFIASFVLEALDTRWRNSNDLRIRFGLNFLGAVPGNQPLINLSAEEAQQRSSAVKEAHTQIVLAGLPRNARTLMVSGPHPSQERSALVVDLAQCYTLAGYRVLLVDAETEQALLSSLFNDPDAALQPIIIDGEAQVWSSLRVVPIKNILLLARNTDENGKPLPPSQPWPTLVENLQRAADILIFDGPSTLSGVEAALLAPLVDGVVLALRPVADSSHDIQQSLKRLTLKRTDHVLGAVMLTDKPVQTDERPRLPLPMMRKLLTDMPLRLLNPGKEKTASTHTEAKQDEMFVNTSQHRQAIEPRETAAQAENPRVIVTPPPTNKAVMTTHVVESQMVEPPRYARAVGESVLELVEDNDEVGTPSPQPIALPSPTKRTTTRRHAHRRPVAGRRRQR
ncbi:polysaccharide biosynthesis tyrosine autokinase [Chloroflexus aggregans]|uniref:Lipopolysaccharide biosynthesis protein n=1 Tax=Chloroflexus aggregans (strain MD-66 / DSM 9485) TaxID=326427 RepID=B8G5K4_CHLAD|nr:LPS biosynthesis protein [Chloroflexus aggregans]ACL23715.1 lipopolysaccharide biosynthesis protein [Chloroflexus aggregans DSM 9485]